MISFQTVPVKCATTAACFAAAACWADPFDEYKVTAFVVTTAVPVDGVMDDGAADGTFLDFIIPPPPTLPPSSWYMPPDIAVHVQGTVSTGTHIEAKKIQKIKVYTLGISNDDIP